MVISLNVWTRLAPKKSAISARSGSRLRAPSNIFNARTGVITNGVAKYLLRASNPIQMAVMDTISSLEALLAELETTRERGYAVNDRKEVSGTRVVETGIVVDESVVGATGGPECAVHRWNGPPARSRERPRSHTRCTSVSNARHAATPGSARRHRAGFTPAGSRTRARRGTPRSNTVPRRTHRGPGRREAPRTRRRRSARSG